MKLLIKSCNFSQATKKRNAFAELDEDDIEMDNSDDDDDSETSDFDDDLDPDNIEVPGECGLSLG